MSRMNSFVAGLGLAALLSTSAAFAGDAESCKTVRFSDVGWTDITGDHGGHLGASSTALGYEPKTQVALGAGDLCLAEEQGHRRLPRQLDADA